MFKRNQLGKGDVGMQGGLKQKEIGRKEDKQGVCYNIHGKNEDGHCSGTRRKQHVLLKKACTSKSESMG